jgi:hypothetical protein
MAQHAFPFRDLLSCNTPRLSLDWRKHVHRNFCIHLPEWRLQHFRDWYRYRQRYSYRYKVKQSRYRPGVAQRVPGNYGSQIMTMAPNGGKAVSLTHRPHLPPGSTPGTHFCQRLSRPQGHSAIRRIYVNEKFDDIIWDRISDLLICSAVP